MSNHLYAMIMAGGGGTRLWPLSRRDRPKQSLPLVTDKTMFHISVERLLPMLPFENIFVVTGADQVAGLRADMPELPADNFIVEPSARDNGPAAGLGIAYIAQRDPEAVIAYLPSDHFIADEDSFRSALQVAFKMAQDGYITTLGISPSDPSTAFGYIKRGDSVKTIDGLEIFEAAGFREKPDAETAMNFILSGDYCWNAGMFIWTARQALAEFEKQQPAMYADLMTISATMGTDAYQATLDRIWPNITKIALDYAVMEHAEKMALIPVSIGWSDIGNWAALYEVLSDHPENSTANVSRSNHGELITVDSSGNLVLSEKMVVTIGLHDVVIVDTEDVLLVCPLDRAQEVRTAVEQLKANGRHSML